MIKTYTSSILRPLSILILGISLFACNSEKLQETPMEQFIGTWELHGRTMFDGITVKIDKTDSRQLIGEVITINDNKYVKMFVEPGDIWVSGIDRSSNYQFKLTEKKIGSALFGAYGIDTSEKFSVQFKGKNEFALGKSNKDPMKSSVIYRRID